MIRIENLSVAFDGTEVVKNVDLELQDGEILGVVGESGSGKSVTALTLMGLVADTAKVTSGRILFDDVVLREAGKPVDRALYRKYQGAEMSMVFQEPMTSLNPTIRVGRQVEEMLRLHTDFTGDEIRAKVLETFEAVGLRDTETVYVSYPHQLSGGMRQRVMIAMAIILHPDLVVCDEPTTALDVTIQNQIIELLRTINIREQNSMLFITHDLNLARRICHRVAVMKDGKVVELGRTEDIFEHPAEEYTKKLIEAVPSRLKRRVSVYGGREVSLLPEWQKQAESGIQAEEGRKAESGRQTEEGRQKETGREEAPRPVVEVRDLSVFYRDGSNSLFSGKKRHMVVQGAEFSIYRGESLGLVGESGCGKTSLSRAILGMNRDVTGEIRHSTVRPQMIFQDPYSSLNPTKTIGWLLQEPLRAAGKLDKSLAMSKGDMEAAAYDMLRRVGMEEKYFHRRPAQLSGGQRQRVSIGQALIAGPGLIVADEPVSALDVTIQAQIMELMQRLQQEMQLSYLFISHDINVVYKMCDRIMVMKEGKILEIGETEELFNHPKQAYTRELLGG
ncbi:MAG: ABC transporter ATP-binding protein [Firmicutes bacterium]|nr:ABC transporter ATP-binding protein [Bacillota bacterium]